MNEDFNQILETLCYDQICKKTFLRLKIYRSMPYNKEPPERDSRQT